MNERQEKEIRELLKGHKADFDYNFEHWENGNFDDSYQYGYESGQQSILDNLDAILHPKELE